MPTIDSLDIQIASSAQKANSAIDSIIKNLGNLSEALNIDTSKLANIVKSINLSGISNQAKAISESMGSMGAKVAQSMKPAQEQTEKVVKSLEQITAQYADLGKGFELKGSTVFIQKQIDNLANSLSKVNLKKRELEASGETGGKTYEYAIRDAIKYTNQIESLTKQLSSLKNEQTQTAYIKIADLDNAEFDKWLETLPSIKAQSEEAAKSIENIGESTKATIQGFTGTWSGIDLPSDLEKINQLEAKLSQLEVPEIREENLDKLYIALDKTEAKLEELRIKLSNGIIMGEITDNIDDSGYVRLQKQIALTEKEAEALRNKILQVSESNDEAGDSAKNLGNSLAKVKNNANSSANSISKLGRNVKSLTRQILSAVGIIGGLSAIIKGIKDSIPNFTDYIESYNYFNVAFEKIGSEWSQDFGKYGYDNAESYAESFTKRMNETLGKLSSVQVNIDTGLLEETGLKNLGLNIQQITQYASQLASVTNSIGQTGEVSLAAASSFTKLAGDISSLFNVDFQDAANNIQSGLLGQSRALYKYGIDITNAALGTYAYNLGLEKSVSEMTQAEKMQLRMLAILDQSKVSWGDLANTIQSPSNMLRQFKNNLKEVSMVFGQLFIPVLQKVMPVINGITIAIKRLLVSFANILGIKIDFDAFGQGYSDLGDGVDDLADGLDGVAKSVKKATAGLRAFDELKVINMPDTSGIGAGTGVGSAIDLTDEILAATAEYEKAWNNAFAKMENTAQEWADKIEKILEPVRKIFEDFAVGDFFQAGKDTSALVTSIIDFFADAIDRVDWYQIGKNIGDFLAGIDWFSVLKSVGNLIWQAIKAAFELYAGVFSVAPIETALISLAAMPKLLKTITASKFITGIVKLWKNFRIWGEELQLVVGALTGNKAAASGLAMLYPKLGAKVDAVKNAFKNFSNSVSQKGIWKTIDSGIANVRNSLSGLQKTAIVAVAGFAEFSVVSSSIEKLTLGTENWLAEIGKIAGAAAAAGAAMYIALGPAGLAIAGITGVVAAIKGINDAFDTIRAEEIGLSIKNAMSNPGGTPLSEVTAQFSDAIVKIGDTFSIITEKSAGLKQADSNIRDTWMEIEKIETSMGAGVLSVEEGTQKLTQLFGELASTASEKFTALENTLITAFGENGVLSGIYERLGVSTENTTATIIQLNDKVEKRIEELTGLLAQTDPSNPNYAKYKEELAGLMAQTDELSESISNYELTLKQIDYSELILPDGTLDTQALQSFLDEISNATKEANANIEEAVGGIKISLTEELNSALLIGDLQSAEEIQEKLDALPQALTLLKSDVALKATELTDTIQLDFINGLNNVISDAQTEWGEKGFWGQIWNGVFGAGTEGEYVKEAVDQQAANIKELSSAIESSLGDLKVDAPGWAGEAIDALYNKLFDTEYHFSDMGGGKTVYSLNEDFQSLINESTSGIAELAQERGKNAADGYADGITDNISTGTDAAKSFTEKVLDKIAEVQKSHSPSKVTQELGKNAADGYAIGIKSNTDNTLSIVSEYTTKILDKFSEIVNPLKQIGIDAMSGLYNGLSSMEESIYSKAGDIANNVANTIKTALDIHSPSRVMFELGDYTMQGFQDGLENLYKPILSSVKTFGRDLQLAPAPNLTDMYGNYRYTAEPYMPPHETSEYMQGTGYSQSNAETNTLLRQQNELLRAILAKPNIGKGELFDINREMYQMESTRRYGNPAAYDPIWGS